MPTGGVSCVVHLVSRGLEATTFCTFPSYLGTYSTPGRSGAIPPVPFRSAHEHATTSASPGMRKCPALFAAHQDSLRTRECWWALLSFDVPAWITLHSDTSLHVVETGPRSSGRAFVSAFWLLQFRDPTSSRRVLLRLCRMAKAGVGKEERTRASQLDRVSWCPPSPSA